MYQLYACVVSNGVLFISVPLVHTLHCLQLKVFEVFSFFQLSSVDIGVEACRTSRFGQRTQRPLVHHQSKKNNWFVMLFATLPVSES